MNAQARASPTQDVLLNFLSCAMNTPPCAKGTQDRFLNYSSSARNTQDRLFKAQDNLLKKNHYLSQTIIKNIKLWLENLSLNSALQHNY
ncbi:hypothetical protein [Bergeyella zoohelcum]|uniref:Uncharacterized protein n=1 Tax=Bergeyella zoohelcum ATCC 43767 TaxID=883096 RepID=K1LUS4_9FLAO|nr:hypothetical protein [Bergeyella zoohelcum]EKB58681.1 hypothetical protein HMPREF9699_00581 [Bergeyella zoohelcum ATCC 43767]SUV49229.1 Uncharacterised protein [Bergeyella zoohelcum]